MPETLRKIRCTQAVEWARVARAPGVGRVDRVSILLGRAVPR
jgi:hypothetical protein